MNMENLERERRDVGVFRDEIWLCVDVCVERESARELNQPVALAHHARLKSRRYSCITIWRS